jgi:hypothetical protein
MDEIKIRKGFFRPVCNESEIERIFSVSNASDYLLKIRAETIVDHMRLFRVYRNKAIRNEGKWSLENSFDPSHFREFIRYLDPGLKAVCTNVCYGNMFSNDPNGSVFKTDYGPIITISDSLKFFFKFMHLTLLNFEDEVPENIRWNSLRIAIRVMLKTEALDFFMDPRGILPESIAKAIHAPIPNQMLFIAGHEFAHYVLGHLSESDTVAKPIFFAISSDEDDYKPMKAYNSSQKQELEADVQSLLLPKFGAKELKGLFEAALLWFGCLELYEAVCNAMWPRSPWAYRTHPTARERYENLLMSVPSPPDFSLEAWKNFPRQIDHIKSLLLEDVSVNIDAYETYGSAYLDEPNTEWRGPELIDRVDYY